MPKSPVIPLAPPDYDQRQWEQILQVLRTYFYTLDNPDKWKTGELYITACPTEADHTAGLIDSTVWVDDCGFLRLEGADNELCTWFPPSGGATTFLALTDTPAAYTGEAGKLVVVNSGETALEFVDAPFDAGGFYPGTPGSSAMIMGLVFVRSVDFPADMTGARTHSSVAATAQTDFDLQKNGVSFGTMRFAAAATSATFVSTTAASFVAGDVLTVIAPASPDATLANVKWNFKGTKV